MAIAQEAAAATEHLQAMLSSVAQVAAEAVHQPAAHAVTTAAHAGTLRADGGRGAVRATQAAAIYHRFLEKLQGGSMRISEQRAHGRGHQPAVRTGDDGDQEGRIEQPLLGVSEQVSVLINEATSLDNLAQMYEGWSAWI